MKEEHLGPRFRTAFVEQQLRAPTASKKELIDLGFRLWRLGLAEETYGNLSSRLEEGMLITASGSRLGSLSEDDFVEVLRFDPNSMVAEVRGKKEPSSETPMHWLIYRHFPEVRVVAHVHDPKVLRAVRELGLPQTRKLPYGSVGLAAEVVRLLRNTRCSYVVLRDHGSVAVGMDAGEVYERILKPHQLAEQLG